MNDSEIIAAVRAGDSDAFAALVERYRGFHALVAPGTKLVASPNDTGAPHR